MNIFNELKDTATKQPTILAPLAGVLTPAALAPIAAITLIGATAFYAISKLKSENEDLSQENERLNNDIEALTYEGEYEEEYEPEPYNDEPLNLTVHEPLNEPLNEPLGTVDINGSRTVQAIEENPIENAIAQPIDEKEMIRRTMSELGKRSAAARRRKKENV